MKLHLGCSIKSFGDDWIHIDGSNYPHIHSHDIVNLPFEENTVDLIYLPLFLIGSVLVRSSGCIINDLLDQKLDKKVARTKNRPIASSQISIRLGILYVFFFLLRVSFICNKIIRT